MPRRITERTVVRLAHKYVSEFPSEAAKELEEPLASEAAAFLAGLPPPSAVAILAQARVDAAAEWLGEFSDEVLERLLQRLDSGTLERAVAAAEGETRARIRKALPAEADPGET